MKVGDYVRNENFGIGKINRDYFDDNKKHWYNVQFKCYQDNDNHCGICEESIGFKSSPNIIDLIEVGDYVNGQYVCEKFYDYANEEWNIVIATTQHLKIGKDRNDIKSIVTYEQFEAMKYEL